MALLLVGHVTAPSLQGRGDQPIREPGEQVERRDGESRVSEGQAPGEWTRAFLPPPKNLSSVFPPKI